MLIEKLSQTHAAVYRRRLKTLALFCLINFTIGALYVWSVFGFALAPHLSALTGTTVTHQSLGFIFGVASGILPFMMLAGGWVNDRFGPKLVIAAGGVLIGIGYLLAARSTTVSELMLGYGCLVGIGTGLINGCTISSAVKLFPDRRGFAGGLVTASLGTGAAVLPFAASALIASVGIENTLAVFGFATAAIIVPAALLTERAPEGFAAALCPAFAEGGARTDKDWLGMIRSRTFLPLALLFMTSAVMGLMLLSSVSGIAQSQIGMSAAAAALAVSVLSIANTAGRFLSGTLSDRFGRVETLIFGLIVSMFGLLCLAMADHGEVTLFFAGLIGVGLCFGAFFGIFPSLVADEYGPTHNSVNFSILTLGYSVGGLLGPVLLKSTGDYGFAAAYYICLSIAGFGLLLAALYKFIKKSESGVLSLS